MSKYEQLLKDGEAQANEMSIKIAALHKQRGELRKEIINALDRECILCVKAALLTGQVFLNTTERTLMSMDFDVVQEIPAMSRRVVKVHEGRKHIGVWVEQEDKSLAWVTAVQLRGAGCTLTNDKGSPVPMPVLPKWARNL